MRFTASSETHTLFPCKNSRHATKTCIEKTLAALRDDIEWQIEFSLLQSSEPGRAELIRVLEEPEKARAARQDEHNRDENKNEALEKARAAR